MQLLEPSAALAHSDGNAKDAHATLIANSTLWERLSFAGLIDGGDTLYEQRTCPACGSSLCRKGVDAARIDELLASLSHTLAASAASVMAVRRRPPRAPVVAESGAQADRDTTRPCPAHVVTKLQELSAKGEGEQATQVAA